MADKYGGTKAVDFCQLPETTAKVNGFSPEEFDPSGPKAVGESARCNCLICKHVQCIHY